MVVYVVSLCVIFIMYFIIIIFFYRESEFRVRFFICGFFYVYRGFRGAGLFRLV